MRTALLFSLLLSCQWLYSQTIIEWSPDYQLQLGDFQSVQTEINGDLSTYSIFSGTTMDFSFQMPTGVFMFTKNFNSKATTTFNRNTAVIIAPDSAIAMSLVKFGQYNFDLTELYTRKFRQKLYEEKGAFSDINFFLPIYQELQAELNAEIARVYKLTETGLNSTLLEIEHEKVLSQIDLLSDFCKSCKPSKKKRKKE